MQPEVCGACVRLISTAACLWIVVCLALSQSTHAAEPGPLSLDKKGSRAIITGRGGSFRVVVGGVGNLARIQWKDRFQRLHEVGVRVRIRWGHMYDLYQLNEPALDARYRTTSVDAREEHGNAVVVAEGEGLGFTLHSRATVDPQLEGVQLAMTLTRRDADRQRKYQIQYVVSHRTDDPSHVAWVAPGPGKFAIMRFNDHSDQEIFDQASHATFFRTTRLPGRYAILASVPDGKGVLFSGDNLRYLSWGQRRDRIFCYLYGNDAYLEDGETLSQTLALRPIDGLGGVSLEEPDCLAGIGGLLTRRYVTSADDAAAVRFTCPGHAFTSEARVLRDGETVLAQSGQHDVKLDTSKLPDGTYSVVKRLQIGDRRLEGSEELRVLRTTYADIDQAVAKIKAFVQAYEPDAAKDPNVARIRLAVIDFKLAEVDGYKRLHQVGQVRGLIKDAARAVAALERGEPAVMPSRGPVVFSHDLLSETDAFRFFGAGDIEFTPEHGLYVQGVGTVNMWTTFAVHGSFMVEFDYSPLESPKGGTMLQICGQHPNPISQYDFMCSASWGSMAYYMFGVRCYHFSFGVRGRVCRLRKTGKGFYILTHVTDPVPDLDKWYHLVFVKEGNHLMFFADGKLVQEYFDEGHQGPALDGGHIGIRNWSTHRSYFRNFKVCRVRRDEKP